MFQVGDSFLSDFFRIDSSKFFLSKWKFRSILLSLLFKLFYNLENFITRFIRLGFCFKMFLTICLFWIVSIFTFDSPLIAKNQQFKRKIVKTKIGYVLVADGFQEPTDIQFFPGDSKRMIVLEKRGRLIEIDLTTKVKTIRADLTGQIETRSEEGLLGLAFSPDFQTDSKFFVNVIVKEGGKDYSKILEFEWKDHLVQKIEHSKRIILKLEQPYSNHNGGQLTFGPDRKLYVGFGDGGGANDPYKNGQNPDTFLGKLLRILPNPHDSGAAYKVPEDNPFVHRPGFLPEIWSYGFRNPWRFSFDKLTGELYLADVGQNEFEEIDLIQKGGNYGWNIREGFHCFKNNPDCIENSLIDPIHEYSREEGQSITGGYVYRGKEIPKLVGSYLYGDFVTGKIWALKQKNGKKISNELVMQIPFQISTFGQDISGEVYFTDFGSGNIFRIIKKN
ncbi:PQQ-dependent sugar dehydrogenase [Leptospira noguchii]|uniref:PQQ-dependent sugar dehydrogenase n=1 Tax=Leptospira noguchii TaxID=28182 RepID=A0AAE9GLQ0_9LEPT|nr:PQQ-dependent sugar dehydrogenase [Leptospira noguchii]UOG32220.1 PQQ-dependent sugar dehydrogenase [Leptospira noguchii]UOG58315.1 PQQ-dependent sugar dehydrogenase [Leptospira noguchii]